MGKKIKGYWTFEEVKKEALKYISRNDFNKLSKSAYLAAHRNGWLDDVCSHMKKNDYTFNRVKEEALKFSSRSEFKYKSNNYYHSAHRNGWLDDVCSHMTNGRMPNGYWTIDRVREESLKFNNRKDFKNGSSSAYDKARNNNWLDDVCSHMINFRSFNEWVSKIISIV